MSRFNNVRNKPRKDIEIERLRRENAELRTEQSVGTPRPMPSRRRLRALGYQRYLSEGGHELNLCIRNAAVKSELFARQVDAATSVPPIEPAGPNITAYEDRMGSAQQMRLLMMRNDWVESCIAEIEREFAEGEPEHPDNQPGESAPTRPEQADLDQLAAWIKDPESPLPAKFHEMMRYLHANTANPENLPPEMQDLARQVAEMGRKP